MARISGKSVAAAAVVLLARCPDAAALGPDGLTLYGTATTDYVYRGITQSNEDPALQLGLDYQHRSGLFAGAWGSTVEFPFESHRRRPRDVELNVYAGYAFEPGRRWRAALAINRKSYPDASVDYDYFELSANVGYNDALDVDVDYTNDWNGHGWAASDVSVTARRTLPFALEAEIAGGRFAAEQVVSGGYLYWNIGLSRAFGEFVIDIRYHDTDGDAVDVFGALAGARWVASVSFAL